MFIWNPPNVANTSAVQNDTSCVPSPCGRLSRPRTTTDAPPSGRFNGGDSRCFATAPLSSRTSGDEPQCSPFTRPDFSGSLISTQTFPLRLQSLVTHPTFRRLPRTSRSNWLVRDHRYRFACMEMKRVASSSSRSGQSLFQDPTPGRLPYYRNWGLLLPKVMIDSSRSHTEILPGRTATAMKPRLCPPLSRELFSRPSSCSRTTYPLGTVAGQTATVSRHY